MAWRSSQRAGGLSWQLKDSACDCGRPYDDAILVEDKQYCPGRGGWQPTGTWIRYGKPEP
jgi:hypothetical protein